MFVDIDNNLWYNVCIRKYTLPFDDDGIIFYT